MGVLSQTDFFPPLISTLISPGNFISYGRVNLLFQRFEYVVCVHTVWSLYGT